MSKWRKIRVFEGTLFHKGLIEHTLTHSDKVKCNLCEKPYQEHSYLDEFRREKGEV